MQVQLYIHVYNCKQISAIAVYLVAAATTGYQTNSTSRGYLDIYYSALIFAFLIISIKLMDFKLAVKLAELGEFTTQYGSRLYMVFMFLLNLDFS